MSPGAVIPLANEKLAGLEPRWAPFPGFSLLWDNPGASLAAVGALGYLEARVGQQPELSLYWALAEGLERLGHGKLLGNYGLCPLPPASYHVTVWDGVNRGNLARVAPERRAWCQQLLDELPHSLSEFEQIGEIATSPLLIQSDWGLQLRWERLEKWSNVSLVARLAPADAASQRVLDQLIAARAALSAAFLRGWGVAPCESYVPHVTLGYFANPAMAEAATPLLEAWNSGFQERTTGQTLAFERIGLYGFRDMATFFRSLPK